MEEKITEIISKYKGQSIDFALEFEKSGGNLPKQLADLFVSEMANQIKQEKFKFINDLEQLILVWNNNVLMGKLQAKRDEIESSY